MVISTGNSMVINCTFNFSGNTATGFGTHFGGGIHTDGDLLTVANTGFCFNTPDQIEGPINDDGGNSLLYCPPPPPSCSADVDGDGTVGINDFLDLLASWGPCK